MSFDGSETEGWGSGVCPASSGSTISGVTGAVEAEFVDSFMFEGYGHHGIEVASTLARNEWGRSCGSV